MVLKIAHRGASGYVIENSIESFKKAIELNADIIEFDIRKTRDDEIIVMHDKRLDRTSNGSGEIKDFTFEEIRKLRLKNGELIPTFWEALEFIAGKSICKVDIKDTGLSKRVIDALRNFKIEDGAIITSEIPDVLKEIKELSKKVEIEAGGFSAKIPVEEIINKAKSIGANIIGTHYKITDEELMSEATRNKLKVHVWTVNDKETIEKMKIIKVDGITSNYIDLI